VSGSGDRRTVTGSQEPVALFKTKNDLSEEIRDKAVELLNARLADGKDLQTQVKHAHWNVKGPNFIALHELFDGINEEVEDYVDDIAERAVQPGGVAEGTARMVVKQSTHALGPETALVTLVEPGDYRARRRTGMPGVTAGGPLHHRRLNHGSVSALHAW
jgi:starvation-inducible DNA-binding protein